MNCVVAMSGSARKLNATARSPGYGPVPDDLATIRDSLRLVAADEYVMRPGLSSVMLRPYWLLEMIVEGEMELTVDEGPPVIRAAGSGILYLPQSRCRERVSDRVRDCRSQTIIFQDDGGWFRLNLGSPGSHLWIEDDDHLLSRLIESTGRALHRGPAGLIGALGRFYQVIGLLLSSHAAGPDRRIIQPDNAVPPMVMQAHRFMRRRLSESISVRDIAGDLQMSDSGFAHAYRRITGQSPMAALRAMRIEAARHELLRGRYNLDAIARATGFADASHLSRTFKQQTGQSPRAFLRAMIAEQ